MTTTSKTTGTKVATKQATKVTPTAKTLKRDSATALVQNRAQLRLEVEPNLPLDEAELVHFRSITQSREYSTWDRFSVTIACNLARTLVLQDQAMASLKRDGLSTTNAKGTVVCNAMLQAALSISSTVQALSRTLGLNASNSGFATVEQKNRNHAQAEARRVVESSDDEGLLA